MEINEEVRREFEAIVEEAKRVSSDIGQEVEEILKVGGVKPLNHDEAYQLLTRVVNFLKQTLARRGDVKGLASLQGKVEDIVQRLIETRDRTQGSSQAVVEKGVRVALVPRNGIGIKAVMPLPCFHGREIPMMSGFVKTVDIGLWLGNERLDIHLGQFRQKFGRNPSSDELLDIMLSKMTMPGVSTEDQFEIKGLARSIAVNGVRKPPIIDIDGTLLDGNRRVAACRFILSGDEFDSSAKSRAEWVFVWQLTEHAVDDDRNAVVVSLNFESDCKQDWPEYVKARKVYDEWQTVLALEPRSPGPQRIANMKRELSKKFALGPETSTVNRYLKMVDWAKEFEDYHINDKKKDTYEVQHKANRYFQYFDELAKGAKPGGVAYALNQDEGFKRLVFDLLFDGKFRNWRQIRELKMINDNEEARDALTKARNEKDDELAEEYLENAMTIARSASAAMREVGANTRIETFVKWLEELPVRSFRDIIKPPVLQRLLEALKLVEKQVVSVLGSVESE
jgi:hypothetical protein